MIQYEGPGWRFERDTSRNKFTVLLGGDNWAVEIAEEEWNTLCEVLFRLIDQYEKSKNQLMKEEQITLDLEKNPWWLSIEGDKKSWDLHLILSSEKIKDRGLEIFWPSPTAEAITSVMRLMWDSKQ